MELYRYNCRSFNFKTDILWDIRERCKTAMRIGHVLDLTDEYVIKNLFYLTIGRHISDLENLEAQHVFDELGGQKGFAEAEGIILSPKVAAFYFFNHVTYYFDEPFQIRYTNREQCKLLLRVLFNSNIYNDDPCITETIKLLHVEDYEMVAINLFINSLKLNPNNVYISYKEIRSYLLQFYIVKDLILDDPNDIANSRCLLYHVLNHYYPSIRFSIKKQCEIRKKVTCKNKYTQEITTEQMEDLFKKFE